MNKTLRAQIAAAFVADIAFRHTPPGPRQSTAVRERIAGTLSPRYP